MLLLEAKAAGAEQIHFSVDLTAFEEPRTTENRCWACQAPGSTLVPHVATGRTGEEALRELVTFLKKIGD